jgi:hypothetical protein
VGICHVGELRRKQFDLQFEFDESKCLTELPNWIAKLDCQTEMLDRSKCRIKMPAKLNRRVKMPAKLNRQIKMPNQNAESKCLPYRRAKSKCRIDSPNRNAGSNCRINGSIELPDRSKQEPHKNT